MSRAYGLSGGGSCIASPTARSARRRRARADAQRTVFKELQQSYLLGAKRRKGCELQSPNESIEEGLVTASSPYLYALHVIPGSSRVLFSEKHQYAGIYYFSMNIFPASCSGLSMLQPVSGKNSDHPSCHLSSLRTHRASHLKTPFDL